MATGAAWVVPKTYLAQVGDMGSAVIPGDTWWPEFPEQWHPQSPWHDRRVRLAANLALDKQAINEMERLGFSRLTGSTIFTAPYEKLRLKRP